MNYLAHCYLSCSDEDLTVGNFITDFLSGSEGEKYSDEIQKGIELHRLIDSYTDAHPISKLLRAKLRARHGKYASVAVDLVWDFFLCYNWDKFNAISKREFADRNYAILWKNRQHLPAGLSSNIQHMIDDDFLLAYDGIERARRSLGWMDKRTKFPSNFVELIKDIEENEEEFSQLFQEFFPDIISKVEGFCAL